MFTKIFGSRNQRLIKKFNKTVDKINALEPSVESLDDAALVARTEEFRKRYKEGESLDALLPEAFATVREAARRALGMRHFDTQLVGGMVLHNGNIAEMRTGEGKTLVATLSAYLNALPGDGVHVITVNDYLARRDAEWMGKVYNFLGLSVGVIYSGQAPDEKKSAYACDVVYGTNNEYGFDYLRDNMAFQSDERMQGKLSFAIVDEVDSILIDEARTPLIISGPAEGSSELYISINRIIPSLILQESEDGPGDYSVDEKSKQAFLTEAGHEHAENLLVEAGMLTKGSSLYDVSNISLLHHLNAALRAHMLFQRDVDYIVNNNEIVIIDEFTGRMMQGRRWSDGLHQAVEAKEGVKIQEENQTLASITFQNYFRLYDKLSGMTGTADTEAFEFHQIYDLEVVVIPTNQQAMRDDFGDQIFRTVEEKYQAIVDDVKDCKKRSQPVLVGTASIDSSEYISGLLQKAGVKHEVLNAKQHEREAHIISHAGAPGSITIATNMAGRGTDIVLGGNLEMELAEVDDESRKAEIKEKWQERHNAVVESGGLHVVGTERHESRRIDNQLRGRSGRQGDPGSTRFYLSLQDSLMRIFASEKVSSIMQKLGMEEGEAIEHPWVSKAIENAQKKVEGRNFDIRKQLLEYDDVANEQRKVIYKQRNDLMNTDDISENIANIRHEVVESEVSSYISPGSMPEQWDLEHLEEDLEGEFGLQLPLREWMEEDDDLHEETLRERVQAAVDKIYQEKLETYGSDVMNHLEKAFTLQVLDSHWKDHLASMDHLRQGIGLRGYAQKDPKQEYKREAFEMFTFMLERIKHEITTLLARVQLREESEVDEMEAKLQQQQQQQAMEFNHPDANAAPAEASPPAEVEGAHTPYVRQEKKVGRNEPCPCGSGKKYKQCHGKIA
ncbi:MAG: preprotein translocase subunit SecA [Pseudomonadota bacterium]|nr:preprotein translocase subunit SecA [Pseudomonadota bacterium]